MVGLQLDDQLLRAFKQSFGIEDVRVMTLRVIQRLVLLAAIVGAVVLARRRAES